MNIMNKQINKDLLLLSTSRYKEHFITKKKKKNIFLTDSVPGYNLIFHLVSKRSKY